LKFAADNINEEECAVVEKLVRREQFFFEPAKITSYSNKLAIAPNLTLSYYGKVKNLGLIINNKLNWNDLVNSLIQKVCCTLRRL
jgi:hypothetical protein